MRAQFCTEMHGLLAGKRVSLGNNAWTVAVARSFGGETRLAVKVCTVLWPESDFGRRKRTGLCKGCGTLIVWGAQTNESVVKNVIPLGGAEKAN